MQNYSAKKMIGIMTLIGAAVGVLFHFVEGVCTSSACGYVFGSPALAGVVVGLLVPVGLRFSRIEDS